MCSCLVRHVVIVIMAVVGVWYWLRMIDECSDYTISWMCKIFGHRFYKEKDYGCPGDPPLWIEKIPQNTCVRCGKEKY